ncbi:MAG: hypothetical protein Q8P18_21535 [Pseudomonadota bacterium]|nr:hypothetical protein [Pseudomonadota bacterium]
MLIRPLINSDLAGLDRLRTRWETARRTIGGDRTLPYPLRLLDGPRDADMNLLIALRDLPRGSSVGLLFGVVDHPGMPLCPMSRLETQLAWERVEETLNRCKHGLRVDRTAFALRPDVVGDRVYVERPRHVEDYLWVDEEVDGEDVEDEPWDDDSDEEENDDMDEEGGDEHVEPVFVLLLVVTSVTTSV